MIVRIRKHPFTIPDRFTPGHCMSEAETQAMNQLVAENVRNNCARWVVEALAGARTLSVEAHQTLQTKIAEYAQKYQFPLRDPSEINARKSPIELEVEAQARLAAVAWSQRQGLDPDDREVWFYGERLLADPEIQAKARVALEAKAQAASLALAELLGPAHAQGLG